MGTQKVLFCSIFCFTVLVFLVISWEPNTNSLIAQYLLTIQSIQRGLHTKLSDALRAIQEDGLRASLILTAFSFVYGALHAAGPGHGKVIISTYLLSHESQLRRGIVLSFAAALTQGLTAVVIVSFAFELMKLSMVQTRGIVNHVEVVSFAMIALVGFYITCMQAQSLKRKIYISGKAIDNCADGSERCDHNHGPGASELEKELSLRSFMGIILSIGIRPCSGAVIVLLLAFSLGHVVAGLFAVLAMSLGTAIAIALLATFSVYFRRAAQRIVQSKHDATRLFDVIPTILGMLGGGLIFTLGLSFFISAVTAPVHPFR
jgi:nickel/cobalt exporter